MNELPFIERARAHGDKPALVTGATITSYRDLVNLSETVACQLLAGGPCRANSVVALLAAPGPGYVAGQWGIWRAAEIFLPLCLSATIPEWEYALSDSRAKRVLADPANAPRIKPLCEKLGIGLLVIGQSPEHAVTEMPEINPSQPAMILYTSGTTSKPKGVVTTHGNIRAQVESLVGAWEWSPDDRVPLFLPLHHIHGIINVLSCGLWTGASIEAFGKFEAVAVLDRVAAGAYTVFMAVPTIYVKMLEVIREASGQDRERWIPGFKAMRLMVSGSAALPAKVFEEWKTLTGQALLERYGMTEIGMAISNPYRGERRPGAVGIPLPGVEIRLKSDNGEIVTGENLPGEIQVRGPGVFQEYWNRAEASRESFDDGWFRTGDVAVVESGYLRILGRQSVDIIKSGGYKLSALEIESVLLEHPAIRECAVVGIADETWGEAVATAAVLAAGETLVIEQLRDWCKARMSVYKIPKTLSVVQALPRNAMGKVSKPEVAKLFSGAGG